ncbi:transcription factor E2F7 [Polymixia lowei]
MEVECLALKDLTSPRKVVDLTLDEDESENEQKENICTERRRSTPPKAESSMPNLLLTRKASTVDLTPVKHADLPFFTEPWTPTANLKMLISAASPDIRDREMRKVLFRPIENEKEKQTVPETVEDIEVGVCLPATFEAVEEEEDGEKKPSRKQKSLGLLCQKFLALYPDYPPAHDNIRISLDEVAISLGVERRRIYDIVNVLESLMIVGRIAKNCYTWYGRWRLDATLESLQRQGRRQGYHLQMEQAAEARETGTGRDEAGPELGSEDGGEGDSGTGAINRKDKSLRIMSQKFVMLFLVSKTQTVTLDAAAKVLIEESQDSSSHSKYKTKVRRLYDIANVLTSLDLIKKVHVREDRGRKPAFQWLGPVTFNNTSETTVDVAAVSQPATRMVTQPLNGQADRKSKLARHASFNITPTSAVVQRQVNSAPSTPRRELTGLSHQPVDYSRRTTGNGPVCRLEFGNGAESRPSGGPQTPAHSLNHLHPLVLPLHPDDSSSSSSSPHHRLAYLPSLSHPSLVMLYGTKPDQIPEGQRSPGSGPEERRKRRRLELNGEVEDPGASPNLPGALPRDQPPSGGFGDEDLGGDLAHYLYVPNNAGLNSLNFLLSASQSPGGLSLPAGGMPALAVPYVLVPSSALSPYPLMPAGLQTSKAHANLSFSLPAVMSPAHFLVGAGPYGLGAGPVEVSGSQRVPSPSSPEQTRPSLSPSGPRQSLSITTQEPLTPHTPKETTVPGSKAFFQTPGTLGSVVTATPVARKRGSAQRRLDVGHPPAS